jgi:DNA repair protein RadD
MTFEARKYQVEAFEALHDHICTKPSNPCVVLPTGSGKSVVMANAIRSWHQKSPHIRGCILAHRKELVQQNSEKLLAAYPEVELGLFAAGLGRKDFDAPLTFASIDSIYKRSGEFAPFDFIFVDEAHRIPPAGEGKYRTFINGCTKINKNLRVVGWTATPFRMGCGDICHENHILNEVCYEAKITPLIDDGFLCNLRSKVGSVQPKLDKVRRNSGGDYITKSLAEATNKQKIVSQAVREVIWFIQTYDRQSVVFFCVDIDHCRRVHEELAKYGIHAPMVTGKTKKEERDRIVADFKARKVNAVCNVNVFTEGFDAPHIDCIVLFRPTLSAGLFSQMVGRGLRPDQSKEFCLVLDYGCCIDTHGPIDMLGGEPTVMAVCGKCRESFSRAIRVCPECGWEIPKREVEIMDRAEAERRLHGVSASKKSILSGVPEVRKVDSVYIQIHRKPGKIPSLRVQYRCGLSMFREWICLDHPGYAGQRAQDWWRQRFGPQKKTATVADAAGNLFASQAILEYTKTIEVVKRTKYYEIVSYNKPLPEETVDAPQ